jgi:hypothetical protein
LGALILGADLKAAVDAYMADPEVGLCPLGGSYMLDLTAAVGANRFALDTMCDPSVGPIHKREAVRAMILAAKPTRR